MRLICLLFIVFALPCEAQFAPCDKDTLDIDAFYCKSEITAGDYAYGNLGSGVADGQFIARRVGNKAKIRIQSFGSGQTSFLAFDRARGTPLEPTALQSGDFIGSLVGVGHDGVGYYHGPEILSQATETWSASGHGNEIIVYTNLNGSASQTIPLKINASGTGDIHASLGHLKVTYPGKTFSIEGSTAGTSAAGSGTLTGTTAVTISTTAASTGMIVNLARTSAGAAGNIYFENVVNGVSFDVKSSNAADTGTFKWWIMRVG